MEQKHVFLSALSIGVGVGVGLGLVSGSTVGKWTAAAGDGSAATKGISAVELEIELLRLVVDGKDSPITFGDFPFFLSEKTRVMLTSAACVHLKHLDLYKHIRNLSPASRAILLSGPAEPYLQMLAMALAHNFDAKLLLLDVNDFSLKIQNKYGITKKNSPLKTSISEATLERVSSFLGSLSMLPYTDGNRGTLSKQRTGADATVRDTQGVGSSAVSRTTTSVSSDTSGITHPKRICNWSFDEKLLLQSLYKVLATISETSSIILYIRGIDKLFLQSPSLLKLFEKVLKKLVGPILVIGSSTLELDDDCVKLQDRLSLLFPYNIKIGPPEDEAHLVKWNTQLEEDKKKIKFLDNKNHIAEVLSANNIECDDLGSICRGDAMVLSDYIDEIVVSALSYHLMNNNEPEYRNGRLVISAKSLSHGLSIFQEGTNGGKGTLKDENPSVEKETENSNSSTKPPEIPPDNEFEKRIRPHVIPTEEIGVRFSDIGSLDETKNSLQELVMLPLRRPDLFTAGGLLKPCRGILLFGPPGTGKTMLAKAIASEAGATFINVSISTITSKWFGEDEKTVRALFTLAAKVSPAIIFVDEVDSMLGQRGRGGGEHEVMRKIKNEFMAHWDGLLTKAGERVLVLAATNRPFDLDEAIIRRFERRIMVNLPSVEGREKILRTLLSKEKADMLDFKELATMTEGYSGSDLKNLCVTAAYRPLREFLEQEKQRDNKKKQRDEKDGSSEKVSDNPKEETKEEEKAISLRPLNMEDIREAKNQVAPSFAPDGSVMAELKQWNEMFGEGGSRKKQHLSYFF